MFTQQLRQASKESTGSSDTDSSSDDESIQAASSTGPPEPNDKVQNAKETEAGAEISALVNYVQPVHFNSFENSESKWRVKNKKIINNYEESFVNVER
jgi:phosphatidylinositol phospholipase C beta